MPPKKNTIQIAKNPASRPNTGSYWYHIKKNLFVLKKKVSEFDDEAAKKPATKWNIYLGGLKCLSDIVKVIKVSLNIKSILRVTPFNAGELKV